MFFNLVCSGTGGFQYQYHQSDAKLTVTVLAGGLTDKDITVDISEHHLTVRVLPPGTLPQVIDHIVMLFIVYSV